jgi:hypothetical protein
VSEIFKKSSKRANVLVTSSVPVPPTAPPITAPTNTTIAVEAPRASMDSVIFELKSVLKNRKNKKNLDDE